MHTPVDPDPQPPHTARSVLVVGDGRMGRAITQALRVAGLDVQGPAGRGERSANAEVVLLAVPDAAIGGAAALIAPGRLVGHFSGATTLAPLAPHEAFSIHPLMSVTGQGTDFNGVPAAIAASTERALAVATDLARTLGLATFALQDEHRAAYHAAASIASNFLVTLEGVAEELAATAHVPRAALVPLVRATVDSWAASGARRALTGPIARGDEATVTRQRAAVADRMPQHLALFDALTMATRDLAHATDDPEGHV